MAANSEMITLIRSELGRITGSKITGLFLMEAAKREKPYMGQTFCDKKDQEYWRMEKQFWLKYKKYFQDLGFVPLDAWNKVKDKPYMLEKF